MKKLLLSIITLSLFFSSSLLVNAEGAIEKILNLNFAVEQIEYKLIELPERSFRNTALQSKYNQLKGINNLLIDEFYKVTKSGEIDYYTSKGIIKNQELFTYHSTKLFNYLEMKLSSPRNKDIDDMILESYSQLKIHYNRIKFFYSRNRIRQYEAEKKAIKLENAQPHSNYYYYYDDYYYNQDQYDEGA